MRLQPLQYVDTDTPKMTKVYVAVYQNVSLSNCNRMTLLTTLYLLGNIRYHEAKVKIRSMIRIYYLVTVLARYVLEKDIQSSVDDSLLILFSL